MLTAAGIGSECLVSFTSGLRNLRRVHEIDRVWHSMPRNRTNRSGGLREPDNVGSSDPPVVGLNRSQARQLVRHGHILVNGKRVTIPSYRVREGDVVSLKPSSRELYFVRRNLDTLDRQLPLWLESGEGRPDA